MRKERKKGGGKPTLFDPPSLTNSLAKTGEKKKPVEWKKEETFLSKPSPRKTEQEMSEKKRKQEDEKKGEETSGTNYSSRLPDRASRADQGKNKVQFKKKS